MAEVEGCGEDCKQRAEVETQEILKKYIRAEVGNTLQDAWMVK